MDQAKENKYNISVQSYNGSGDVAVIPRCNGVTVTNTGDTIAFINDIILFPSATPATSVGDSVSIGGNENEIYKGNLRLKFQAPVGVIPQVEIIQKFFVEQR